MLRIEFGPADLAGLRFAHSPMVETLTSGFVLCDATTGWMYESWQAWTRPQVAKAGVGTFLALLRRPNGYVPDFLTPVPSIGRPSLADELRLIAKTPLDRVAAEVDAA